METALIIIAMAMILSGIVVAVWYYLIHKNPDTPDVPIEPEPVTKPKFKVGDWIICPEFGYLRQILKVADDYYETDHGTLSIKDYESLFCLWDIKFAKDGDVLSYVTDEEDLWIMIYWSLYESYEGYVHYHALLVNDNFSDKGTCCICIDNLKPATKEQREQLEKAMADAGYMWLSHKKELVKLLFKVGDSVRKKSDGQIYYIDNITENGYFCGIKPLFPIELQDDFELVEVASEPEPTYKVAFDLIDYFSSVVKIEKHSKTYNYLLNLYDEAFLQFKLQDTHFGLPILYKKENFPTVYDYYGDKENEYAFEQLCAWLFALILEDIVPERAEQLVWMAYNYKINGASQPMYGYTFETDPHIARMVAGNIWAMTKTDDITQLREELGSKMVTYNKDISELFIHTELFMPTAPGPYLDEYKDRPKGLPVDADKTVFVDSQIHRYVSDHCNLSTSITYIRQATFQAIANKDYHVEHLFGKPRTFIHPQYGEVTVYPVFGKHNIGICIPEDSEIAKLCYEVGKNSSNNRKSLLNQEYGRRRPGQGEKDGTWNDIPEMRVLVDYPTEEYDGHSTGYYNQGGDYVDGNGNHIGDYNTYYQKAVYANSYPSGHSADIEAICNTLIRIMPELADLIIKAKNEFVNSRIITRYHYQSDTIIGREIGTMFLPLMEACTNCNMKERYDKARQEYERIKNGETPTPQPEAKVNVTLGYSCGGYGSCHVDPGETSISHKCNKEANRDRQPSITCSQTVNFTIEGAGVTAAGGKTSGVWEAGKSYMLFCPAVKEGEEKIATITLKNENGIKILYYKCSWNPTHDDGAGKY